MQGKARRKDEKTCLQEEASRATEKKSKPAFGPKAPQASKTKFPPNSGNQPVHFLIVITTLLDVLPLLALARGFRAKKKRKKGKNSNFARDVRRQPRITRTVAAKRAETL